MTRRRRGRKLLENTLHWLPNVDWWRLDAPTRQKSPYARRLRLELLEDRRLLALFTVTNTNDAGEGSLRDAIAQATADVIQFAPALTSGGPATIHLTSGRLVITRDVAINGPGANLLTIHQDMAGAGVLLVDDGTSTLQSVSLSGLTLSGGNITGTGALNYGAGIRSLEHLTITGSVIRNNTTTNTSGGGIFQSGGSLTIDTSTIRANTARSGGGIFVTSNATTIINNSTISGNTATAGVQVSGGGIAKASGSMTVVNSTISGNTANDQGGGINNFSGTLVVRHSTITANRNDADASGFGQGGGIFNAFGATTTLDHTIVAGNFRGLGGTRDDLAGTVAAGYSLIGDNTGASVNNIGGTSLVGTGAAPIDAMLGPLANNGGTTQTHALWTNSPAIGAGDPDFDPADPDGDPMTDDAMPFDQRGEPFVRVHGTRIDIGAFERQPLPPGTNLVVDTTSDVDDGDHSPGNFSLWEAILLVNGGVGSNTITFGPLFNSPQTIGIASQLPTIRNSLTITGPGAHLLTIDAGDGLDNAPGTGDGWRIFHSDDGTDVRRDVTLRGLTLTGGDVAGSGGVAGHGGAIAVVRDNLNIVDSVISGNFATLTGGAISGEAQVRTSQVGLVEACARQSGAMETRIGEILAGEIRAG